MDVSRIAHVMVPIGAASPTQILNLVAIARQIRTVTPLLTEVQAGRCSLDPTEFENWLGHHRTLATTEYLGIYLVHSNRPDHIARERSSNETRAQQLLADDLLKAVQWIEILNNDSTLAAGTRSFPRPEGTGPTRIVGVDRFGDTRPFVEQLKGQAPILTITPFEVPADLSSTLAGVIDAQGLFRFHLTGQEPGALVEPRRTYHVIKVLGRGGMGIVLEAHELDPETLEIVRPVAIKVVLGDDPHLQERFDREGRIHKRLSKDDHILTVYATGKTPARHTCIVMALADGNVTSILDNGQFGNWENRTRLFTEFLLGIEYLHEEGIIHRDIKPDNIFYKTKTGTGQPMTPDNTRWLVADLGISLDATERETERVSKNVIGTPMYLAPEVTLHQDYSMRGDVFAIAATHYQIVAGCHPVDTTRENIKAALGDFLPFASSEWAPQQGEDPPRIKGPREINPGIPQELNDIIMRGLDADPTHRYANAGEYRGALLDFFRHQEELKEEEKIRQDAQRIWEDEAMAPLTMAIEARERGDYGEWARLSQLAVSAFKKALRIHVDPGWAEQGMLMLLEALNYIEREVGVERERSQVLINMQEALESVREKAKLKPELMTVVERMEAIWQEAHMPGVLTVSVSGLATSGITRLRVTRTHLRGEDVVEPGETEDISERFTITDHTGDRIGHLELPYGNHQIDIVGIDDDGTRYGKMRLLVNVQRGRATTHDVSLLKESQIPEGFVPISGGILYVGPPRLHTLPLKGSDPTEEVEPYLITVEPVTKGKYLYAAMLLAQEVGVDEAAKILPRYAVKGNYLWSEPEIMMHRLVAANEQSQRSNPAWSLKRTIASFVSEQSFLGQFVSLAKQAREQGMEAAVKRGLWYQAGQPISSEQLKRMLTQILGIVERERVTVEQAVETCFKAWLTRADLILCVDTMGEWIIWKAPVTWVMKKEVEEIVIPKLQPGARLPLKKELLWVMTGGRRHPWGYGHAHPDYGHIQKPGMNVLDALELPVGMTPLSLVDPREAMTRYRDRSPLNDLIVDVTGGVREMIQEGDPTLSPRCVKPGSTIGYFDDLKSETPATRPTTSPANASFRMVLPLPRHS